jgi:superfamily II DNA or RNA helicase
MSYIISKKGCIIKKKDFSDGEINWIKTDLTVRPSTNHISSTECFKVYLENEEELCLPKFYAKEKFSLSNIMDKNTGKDKNFNFLTELRDEQKNIVDPILEAYREGGGILSLPCGFGKTIMALYFLSILKKKTLIIVHREFLVTHWNNKIKEFLGEVKIKVIRSNTKEIDCDIGICILNTLSITDFPNGFFDSFGNIIIDECHRVSTTTFSKIFFKINSNYMLGLSATPERKDNMMKVIKWHIGDIIPIKRVKHVIDINVKRFILNSNKEKMFKGTFSDKLTTLLDSNFRNNIIVDVIINELNKSNRKFLVLSDRIEHLQKLKIIINNFTNSVGFFIGGMSKSELKKTEECSIILGTYVMASEGLDIPSLNCLVLASPKIEILQTIGRISRLHNRINPLIFDFIDILPVFITEADKRLKLYFKNKYNVDDYIYDEKKNIFEKNISKNRNYNIYLLGENIEENKHLSKNNEFDNLFNLLN